MNIYIRYFDNETIVTTLKGAFDFLSSIQEIELDEKMAQDLAKFIASDDVYPKRYKVRGRNYFIVIKTTAKNMTEFKAKGAEARETSTNDKAQRRARINEANNEMQPGWYDASIVFKRVISIPQTQKFQYVDTMFAARLKAYSRQDCYNKLIDHLRARADVDPRCQFPSIKGRNFECIYRGMKEKV